MSEPIASDWKRRLDELMPLLGHRNWIVVADSAYPAQSKPGIETLVAGEDQDPLAKRVLHAMAAAKHVRANVYTDRELGFVAENDAPGIEDYRRQLDAVLYGARVQQIPHEQIIAKLDKSAEVFCILIIKTNM